MKITMDGPYAYRYAPTERVTILTVNRPSRGVYCVLSMNSTTGVVQQHHTGGRHPFKADFDLVPLKIAPDDIWINAYPGPDGPLVFTAYCNEMSGEGFSHYKKVPDDDE